MRQFWLVWNLKRSTPTVPHGTERQARAEAERLARSNPGETFHVVTSVGACTRSDLHWDEVEIEPPF